MVRLLECRTKLVNFVNADISGGINPVYGIKVEEIIEIVFMNRKSVFEKYLVNK